VSDIPDLVEDYIYHMADQGLGRVAAATLRLPLARKVKVRHRITSDITASAERLASQRVVGGSLSSTQKILVKSTVDRTLSKFFNPVRIRLADTETFHLDPKARIQLDASLSTLDSEENERFWGVAGVAGMEAALKSVEHHLNADDSRRIRDEVLPHLASNELKQRGRPTHRKMEEVDEAVRESDAMVTADALRVNDPYDYYGIGGGGGDIADELDPLNVGWRSEDSEENVEHPKKSIGFTTMPAKQMPGGRAVYGDYPKSDDEHLEEPDDEEMSDDERMSAAFNRMAEWPPLKNPGDVTVYENGVLDQGSKSKTPFRNRGFPMQPGPSDHPDPEQKEWDPEADVVKSSSTVLARYLNEGDRI